MTCSDCNDLPFNVVKCVGLMCKSRESFLVSLFFALKFTFYEVFIYLFIIIYFIFCCFSKIYLTIFRGTLFLFSCCFPSLHGHLNFTVLSKSKEIK